MSEATATADKSKNKPKGGSPFRAEHFTLEKHADGSVHARLNDAGVELKAKLQKR